jgi:hypothetical protein
MTPLSIPIDCPLSPHIIDHDPPCPICRGHGLSVTIRTPDRLLAGLRACDDYTQFYRKGVSDGLLMAHRIAQLNESPLTLQPSLAVLTP